MLKVKNQKTISRLARRSFVANKSRNIFAIIAIVLTTVLFTSLFIVGGTMLKLSQESTFRMVGSSSHGAFKYLTQEEYDILSQHPSIREISYSIPFSIAENAELSKLAVEMRYSEEKNAKWGDNLPTVGAMPVENSDIATSTAVLDALGIPRELGAPITLEFIVDEKEYQETFRLSGYWEGDAVNFAQQAYFSKEYATRVAPISTIPYVQQDDVSVMGTINADLWFSNSINIENKILNVIEKSGYGLEDVLYGVNWGYSAAELDFGTMLGVLMLLVVIMISGYLIIYNIFYISVSKDIQYYGLLKTIGTTAKQIKKIIRKQSLYLCGMGIPSGLLLGFLLGKTILPSIIQTTIFKGESAISINPWIFLFASLFTIITVIISTRNPAKHAAKVSPIEAIRVADVSVASKKETHKAKRVSVFSMATKNVFRNKKKLVSVMVSLLLSVVIVGCVYTIVTGLDMDAYIENFSISDFSVDNPTLSKRFELSYIDSSTIADMKKIEGVESVGAVYMLESGNHKISTETRENINRYHHSLGKESILEDIEIPAHIYGVDTGLYEKLEFYGETTEIDELFSTGNYIYVTPLEIGDEHVNKPVEYAHYSIGDNVTLDFDSGATKEYTVLGYAAVPYSASVMHTHFINPDFILPSEEYLAQSTVVDPLHLFLSVDKTKEESIEENILTYTEQNNLTYQSQSVLREEFREFEMMFLVVGGVLVIILALIGILNFTNSMLTSVLTRKTEIATLQSIGMTGKEVKKMMIFEGLIHGVIVMLLAFSIGQLLVYVLVQLMAGDIWFFSYSLSVVPLLLCIPIIILISSVIPYITYRGIEKESIVERLRIAE